MRSETPPAPDRGDVVLVDDAGRVIGLMSKADAHHEATPLHRGLSCYVVDDAGELLVTRRALGKRSWPGTWTNTFCGHPRQAETHTDAVVRHAQHELTMTLAPDAITCVCADFRYCAEDAFGVVENEICPIFVHRGRRPDFAANPHEVMDWRWVPVTDLAAAVARTPWLVSPWMVDQLPIVARHVAGGTTC